MAIVNIIPDISRTKDYFGSVHIQRGTEQVSSIPEQVLGMIPVELGTDSCFSICNVFKFIEGDLNRFLFRFPSTEFTDNYILEKLIAGVWTEVITGNPDNALGIESGTKFDIGFETNYPTYGGFELDWQKIFDNDGAGRYRFVVNNINVDEKLFSPPIDLFEDTCENKDRNVYIEFESKGRFENFLYTRDNFRDQFHDLVNFSLPWFDAIRFDGRLIQVSPEEEEETVKTGDFSNSIYYSQDRLQYELYAFEMDQQTLDRVNFYAFKSSKVKITDFSTDAPRDYDRVNVVKSGSPEFNKLVNNRKLYGVKWDLKSEFDQGYKLC